MHQKIFVLFPSLLIILSCSLFANQPDLKIISQTPAGITLEISFPSVEINEVTSDQTGAKQVFMDMPGLQNLGKEGYPDAPYFSQLVTLQGKKAVARIIEVKKETRHGLAYRFNRKDPNTVFRRPPLVDIRYSGLFRDIPLFMLTVCPVQVDPASGTVEIVSTLKFELTVTGRKKSVFNRTMAAAPVKLSPGVAKLLLNSTMVQPETETLQAVTADRAAEIYTPGRYKISVKETGLYKITYDLLKQYDVPVDQIDPRRIRLTNRQNEIPVYMKGGGDGTFDPGDYFEFWGEKNRSDLTRK